MESEIVIKRPEEMGFDLLADEHNDLRYGPPMPHAEKASEVPIILGKQF
jgi:hypothetical protein